MVDLSNLRRPEGGNRNAKRVGRGPGSGNGKTSGRGHKGHKARTGTPHPAWFEGGQMPIQRRVPKRGFSNARFRRQDYETVNLRDFERIAEDVITPELLSQVGLVDLGANREVKILGDGDVDRALTVQAHAFSKGARAKIEAAGGTVQLLVGGRQRSAADSESASEESAGVADTVEG
jgi:large subunit ribosomal protein L15